MIALRQLACAFLLLLVPLPSLGDTLRVATFNVELQRKGPGLLLRDIVKGEDPQVLAVLEVIAQIHPDILAVQGFDWDYENRALTAFAQALRTKGVDFPHLFSQRPNTGMATGLDMNGDGRRGDAEDAQGFGQFSGQGGIAVLSRHPIDIADVTDFSALLWRDLPGAMLPLYPDGTPFPSPEAQDIQRLSRTNHWSLPIRLPNGAMLTLLTYHASPPVFDGAEDQNGRRNHDENRLWQLYMDGELGTPPKAPFILAGGTNLDPDDSDGRHVAIRSLLDDTRLQDPRPESFGAATAGDQGHTGPDAFDTVDWPQPGRLRVDYVLPSADLRVVDAGVFWPAQSEPHADTASEASRHRLVWVDIKLP